MGENKKGEDKKELPTEIEKSLQTEKQPQEPSFHIPPGFVDAIILLLTRPKYLQQLLNEKIKIR